jgi:hypothetical protein
MGLIGGTDKGSLHVFTYPFNLDLGNGTHLASPLLDQITAHAGEVTKILLSPDSKYLFSAGTDGTLFIFSVTEAPIMFDKNGQLTTSNAGDDLDKLEDLAGASNGGGPQIVDEALADIVLVRKQEMEEWRSKQESLQVKLSENQRKVEQKLRETKKKYERQYQEIERQKDLDIKDLEKRYEDLRKQKELQDH